MGKNGERTAVVLDEQPLWLEAMEHLLNRAGMRVVAKTTDASEALDLIAVHEPDVLLADYGVRSGELDEMSYSVSRASRYFPFNSAKRTSNPGPTTAPAAAPAAQYFLRGL